MDKIQEKMKTYSVPLGFMCRAKVGEAGGFVAKDGRGECKHIVIFVYTGGCVTRYRKWAMKPINGPLNVLDS